jgi:hypothetical protein
MTNLGLEGKVALITGAAEEVAAGLPGEAIGFAADVSEEDDVQAAVDATVGRFGRIDLHHLNAGIPGRSRRSRSSPSPTSSRSVCRRATHCQGGGG